MAAISLRVNAEVLTVGYQVLQTLPPATSLTSFLPFLLLTLPQLHWPSCLSLNMPLLQDFCTCSFLYMEEFSLDNPMNCLLFSLRGLLRSYLIRKVFQTTLKWNNSSPPWNSILTMSYLSLWQLPPSSVLIIYCFVLPSFTKHHGGMDYASFTSVTPALDHDRHLVSVH